jgi:hypothetical protein
MLCSNPRWNLIIEKLRVDGIRSNRHNPDYLPLNENDDYDHHAG